MYLRLGSIKMISFVLCYLYILRPQYRLYAGLEYTEFEGDLKGRTLLYDVSVQVNMCHGYAFLSMDFCVLFESIKKPNS